MLAAIPPHLPFLDTLARDLLTHSGDDATALSRTLLLLPTRRAVREMGEAFLRITNGKPLLLPRLGTIGDVDDDELLLLGFLESENTAPLPPAIGSLRREWMLAGLLHEAHPKLSDAEALDYAAHLARLLDELQREEIDPAVFRALAPDALAAHWQQLLTMLSPALDAWPAILEAKGYLDPWARRVQLLDRLTALLPKLPYERIVAAGSTGSIPATARLLAAVAALPHGKVVLPGCCMVLDGAAWDRLGESHPQFPLKKLLARLGNTREEISSKPEEKPTARNLFLAASLHPDNVKTDTEEDLAGFHRLLCAHEEEEAEAIALLLREALETPGRTAMLVTPDRALAARVQSRMKRWDISVDDSAGRPLSLVPQGEFLRLIADAAASSLSPVPLLSVLKHPLCAAGFSPATCRQYARKLETLCLRGVRPACTTQLIAHTFMKEKLLAPWWQAVEKAFSLIGDVRAEHPTRTWLENLIAVAETLAATDTEPSDARLWSDDAGRQMQQHLREIIAIPESGNPLDFFDFSTILGKLLAHGTFRPSYGSHPRLHILSPLEARLMSADRVILGGLNEGVWPSSAPHDPWLSREMRDAAKLPPKERHTGQEAHDFWVLANSPEVFLTATASRGGVPALPSRWWQRIALHLGEEQDTPRVTHPVLSWIKAGASLVSEPAPPPTPTPPGEARPREWSATKIERLISNPYGVYAREILGLNSIDALDAEPEAMDFGIILHRALERFADALPNASTEDYETLLLAKGREAFGDYLERPAVAAFWWPRFERIAAWLTAFERKRQPGIARLFPEWKGELTVPTAAGYFVIQARADRIELGKDGAAVVIDYKTGQPPKPKDIRQGFKPQLPLEAWLVTQGGFPEIAATEVRDLLHVHLSGAGDGGSEQAYGISKAASDMKLADVIAETAEGVKRLLVYYAEDATPFLCCPWPEHAPKPAYDDYAHLARRAEWEG
ncbi:MAG: double-strand break repair protein AddB [Alphaproteobacteria bacterium]|nr:double-strand break repair protein AddB [Alphaproteobacteria bacterium]